MGIFGSSIAEGAQRRPDAGSTRPSSGIPGSTDFLTLNLAKSGGPTGILGGVSVDNLIGGSLAGFGVGSLLVQPGYDPTTGYFLFDPPSMPAS